MGTMVTYSKKGFQTFVSIPARIAVLGLKGYHRIVSPWLGNVCRFHPSCSVYAMEVITTFGLLRGSWFALKRLGKCHPFHPGGLDYPPKK